MAQLINGSKYFLPIQNNRLLFVPETLIALRVQNKKNYANNAGYLSLINALIAETIFTFENVETALHKLLILVTIPLKFSKPLAEYF